jgi:multicomponent Na+:H+ antiporter subunit E
MSEEESDLVYVVPGRSTDDLDDVLAALDGDAADRAVGVDVHVVVSTDRQATGVEDRADRLAPALDAATVAVEVESDPVTYVTDRVAAGGVDRVLAGTDTEVPDRLADTSVSVQSLPTTGRRSRRLVHDRSAAGFVLTFALSYAFYLALGDPTAPFDVVTGAVTAGVVAASLSGVVVETSPSLATVVGRTLRATLFLPYLLVEVVRANLAVAYVILHPSLPVEPAFVTYDPGVENRLERAVLGNAITLTPGTVTVEADADGFLVHTLTAGSREGLREGALTRAVAWVFHGRDGRPDR